MRAENAEDGCTPGKRTVFFTPAPILSSSYRFRRDISRFAIIPAFPAVGANSTVPTCGRSSSGRQVLAVANAGAGNAKGGSCTSVADVDRMPRSANGGAYAALAEIEFQAWGDFNAFAKTKSHRYSLPPYPPACILASTRLKIVFSASPESYRKYPHVGFSISAARIAAKRMFSRAMKETRQ